MTEQPIQTVIPLAAATEAELRELLRVQLGRTIQTDAYALGYLVAFVSRHMRLDKLERLVDELDLVTLPAPPHREEGGR
jgi:hypothetical protein